MGSQSLEPSLTALLLNMAEKFNLSWDAFQSNLGSSVRDLRDNHDFCDVTLAAENDQVKAHKIIISAGSPFFQKVLKRNEHGHPLLYLKGIKMSDLKDILAFMYHGQVEVSEDNLSQFLESANELEILGLSKETQAKNHQWMFNRSREMEYPTPSPMMYPNKEPVHVNPPMPQHSKRRKLKEEVYEEHYEEPNTEIQRNLDIIENYEGTGMEAENEMTIDSYPEIEEIDETEYADDEFRIANEEDEALNQEIAELNSELKTLSGYKSNSINETGEQRHTCHICPKSYKNKSDLNAHVYNHSNAFSFSCDQCGGKKFKSKNSLRMHLHNIHQSRMIKMEK